jgi:flagellar biosynthetic protein FliR
VGLASASELNPTVEQQDVVLAQVMTLIAMLLALGMGAHRVALGYLLGSFRAIPVGRTLAFGATSVPLTDLAIDSFVVGIRLAMPVIAVAFVVHLGLAMIARAAPALQIFNVGFSVLLATGFLVFLTCFRDIGGGLIAHFSTLAPALDGLLLDLSGNPR